MNVIDVWSDTLSDREPGSCASQVQERLAEALNALIDVRNGHGDIDVASIALESAEATIAAVRKQIQAHAAEEVKHLLASALV